MTCTTELPAWPLTLTIVNSDIAYVWEQRWMPSTGVGSIDLTADVRNLDLGTSAAVSLKPALQFAPVRTDRPDAGGAISDGSVLTSAGMAHFRETVSASGEFFFRRGWAYQLTAGSFASVELLLYAAFKSCGLVLPARQIVVHPYNADTDVSYFPISGRFPTAGVDVAKAAVIGQANANSSMKWRLAGRVFTDPQSPGSWTQLETAWHSPSSGHFESNTGEVSLTGLSVSANQWMELALAVCKNSSQDSNSQVIFQIM